MAPWEQWLRDFMKGWFTGLVDGISGLDMESQSKVLSSVQTVVTKYKEFHPFLNAWSNSVEPEAAKGMITESLDQIMTFESKEKFFFQLWFGALMESVQVLNADSRNVLFSHTGRMCAESFAKTTFMETWKESDGIEEFIGGLNRKMGDGAEIYRIVDESTVEATYPKCFCPLVDFGLMVSPLICNCSNSWLESNFGISTDKEVTVEQLESVRTGGSQCRFRIKF